MPRATSPKRAVHAIAGSDTTAIARAAADLALRLAPKDAGEFGTETIDGNADTVDQAVRAIRNTREALLTLPFLGGSKLVFLKHASFLADSVTGRSESTLAALEDLAQLLKAGLPDGVTLLLSAPDADKRRSFFRTLSAVAHVTILDRIDSSRSGWEADAAALASEKIAARKLRTAPGATELLAILTGGDATQLDAELDKIETYLADQPNPPPITPDLVRLLVPLTRAGVVFELGNAIAARQPARALALIDQLLDEGESAIGILLAAIVPTCRNLLLAHDLLHRHRLEPPHNPFQFGQTLERLPASALAHLPKKKDGSPNTMPLGFAAKNCSRFSAAELRALFAAAAEANLALVSGTRDGRLALSRIVSHLLPATPAASPPARSEPAGKAAFSTQRSV